MFEIKVPATSANLGAGFDCFGLALQLYLTVKGKASSSGNWEINVSGQGVNVLPKNETNLIARVANFVASAEGISLQALSLEVENNIPLARGLGSSAAAIVSGIAVVEAIRGQEFEENKFFHYATEFENHPDNIAAARYGGFTIAAGSSKNQVLVVKQPWPAKIKALVTIPDFLLDTQKARSVLPTNYSRSDAVFNLQHALLFQSALVQENYDLIGEALLDKWHQPFRAPLVPGLEQALVLEMPGLLGVALSGSGPTLLALVTENFDKIAEALKETFAKHNISAETKLLEINTQGRIIE